SEALRPWRRREVASRVEAPDHGHREPARGVSGWPRTVRGVRTPAHAPPRGRLDRVHRRAERVPRPRAPRAHDQERAARPYPLRDDRHRRAEADPVGLARRAASRDHAFARRQGGGHVLTRIGEWARARAAEADPWTNVYGVGRSMLAIATAITLV